MIEVALDDDEEALVPAEEPLAAAEPPLAAPASAPAAGASGAAPTAGGAERGEPGKRGGSGFLGKVKSKASETARAVKGSQHVQAGVGFVKDASKVISDQGHQGMKLVKGKTKELAESNQVQKSLGYVKDKTKEFKELDVVKHTTKEFKELGAAMAETADLVSRRWRAGGGEVERRPASVWRGGSGSAGARATLGLDNPGETWRGVDIQAIEEITIPARGWHTLAHTVSKGSRLRWLFCVKEHSVEFGVRTRAFHDGQSVEEEVLPLTKYGCAETIQGSWVADENWTVDLLFDNRASVLRPKTIAYAVGVEPPGTLGASGGAAASSATAAPSHVAMPLVEEDLLGGTAAEAPALPRQAEAELGEDLLGAPPPIFSGAPAPPPAPLHELPLAGGSAPAATEAPAPDPPPPRDLAAPRSAVEGAEVQEARGGGADGARGEAAADAAFEDLWGSLVEDDSPPAGPGSGEAAAPGGGAGDLL